MPITKIVQLTPEISKIIKDALLGKKPEPAKIVEKPKKEIKKVEPGDLFNKSKAKLLKNKKQNVRK